MKKSFFYRVMVLSLGALLAGIIACKNPASPDPVNPEQNVQTPSDNGSGGGGTPKPGEPTPGGGGGGGDGPAPTPNPVNPQTDQERVEAAKAVLELRVNGKVRNWINLPSRGAYGTSISWTSSPSGIINTNAPGFGSNVTQPEEDTEVTLTATITKGSAMATKTFTVTVYGKNQELVDRAVKQMQEPPAFVMGSGTPPETMALQKTYNSGSNQVNFEWKAQPEGSITFSENTYDIIGTVMQPESSAEKKTVTLTATAKKGNATASRTFTVTVYPKNQTPSLDELLTQIMDTVPAETDKDIPLMRTVAYGYNITWSSSDTDVLNPAYGNNIVNRDLVDRKVTLTAKLSKNGSPSETAQKEKEVTVKKQTKFDNCELAGDLLTMKDGNGTATAVYRVQIDAGAKKITATAEQAAFKGTLMTLDAIKQQQLAQIDPTVQYYRSLLSLCDKPIVTLKELKDAFAKVEPVAATMSDEVFFNAAFKDSGSYAEFLNKSAEEQTQIIKEKFLNPMKESIYKWWQIPPNTPLEQALAQGKEQQTALINARIENAKKPRAYTYRVELNRLYTEALYVSGTPWYQQHGQYSYYDWASPDIQYISLSSRAKGNGKYDVSISVQKNGSPQGWFSASDYDGSGAITAKTHDGSKQIILTVTDNGSGKVEVTSTGEIPFTAKELTFRGEEISHHPLRN